MEARSLFFTGSIWICGSAKIWLILVFKMDDHLTLVFKTQSWVSPWKKTVSLPIYGGKGLQRFPYQTQWPNFNFPQSQYFHLLLVWLRGKESHAHRHPQHSPAEARSLLELCVSWHKIKSKCLALNEVIWFEFSGKKNKQTKKKWNCLSKTTAFSHSEAWFCKTCLSCWAIVPADNSHSLFGMAGGHQLASSGLLCSQLVQTN